MDLLKQLIAQKYKGRLLKENDDNVRGWKQDLLTIGDSSAMVNLTFNGTSEEGIFHFFSGGITLAGMLEYNVNPIRGLIDPDSDDSDDIHNQIDADTEEKIVIHVRNIICYEGDGKQHQFINNSRHALTIDIPFNLIDYLEVNGKRGSFEVFVELKD